MRYLVAIALVVAGAAALMLRGSTPVPPAHERAAATGVTPRPDGRRPSEGSEAPPHGLRLEGQVVDGSEQPVGDATVLLGPERRVVRVEADGSFAIADLEPGDYTLTARAGERVGFHQVRLTGPLEPVVIIVSGGARLQVAVRARGGPVEGAELYLAPLGLVIATDQDGEATLEGIPAGRHALQVRKPGFANVQRVLTLAASRDATRMTVELAPGGAVEGIVEGPDGRPAAGAKVSLVPSGGALAGVVGELSAESDAEGRFRIDGAAAGTATLIARHPEHSPSDVVSLSVVAGGKATTARLVLHAGRRVTGRVVDDTGPVEGALVTLSGDRLQHTRSGPDGSFTLRALPEGTLTLVAARGGRSSGPVVVEHDGIELRLPPAAELAGTVVDRGGEPVARARVIAVARGLRRVETADEGGRFHVRDLAEGSYRLHADWPDARNGDRALLTSGTLAHTGDREVRVLLSGRATLRGRLARADGGEVGRFTVKLGRGSAAPFSGVGGEFAVDDVPAGAQWIVIGGPGFAEVTLPDVAVPESGVLDLGVIPVGVGRRLRGRVVDEQGAPVAGARVQSGRGLVGTGDRLLADAEQGELAAVRSAESASDGSFEIVGLSRGGGVAAAELRERGRASAVVVPPGEADVVVELVLRPDASLSGELVGPGGPSAERDVVVSPVGAGNVRFLARTDSRGAFRFDRLAAGRYVVAGYAPPLGQLSCAVHTVVEVAGSRAGVTLALPPREREVELALGDSGRPALVYVIPGDVAPATVAAAEAASQEAPSGLACAGLVRVGTPTRLDYPAGGTATLCVAELPVDANDPNAGLRIVEGLPQRPVICGRLAPGDHRFALAPR